MLSTDVVEEHEHCTSRALVVPGQTDAVLSPNPNESAHRIGRHNSRTPTEIAQERIDLCRKLGICVVCDDSAAIKRIMRRLRKKLENK